MQTIFNELVIFTKTKGLPFLKQSLLIPLVLATLLYILMRVFFIGSEFDLEESVELYIKTFLVTWSYITAWTLICHGIIWFEKRTSKIKRAELFTMNVLKRAAIIVIVTGTAYRTRANSIAVKNISVENTVAHDQDIVPQFYLWMKG